MIKPTHTSLRPDDVPMPGTLRNRRESIQYRPTDSVTLRLSALLGVREGTAHQWLYGEQGIRAKCLRVIRALREVYGDVKAREWMAPILSELDAESFEGDVLRETLADNAGSIAVMGYVMAPCPQTRRAAYLALETEAAEALALARKLRAEEEAAR